jgi:putative ABC transport system permease protein
MMSRLELWAGLFLRESIEALLRRKVQSALAAFGITIAVAAVVCVMAIGRAGSRKAQDQLENLGDALVWVEAGSRNIAGTRTGSRGATTLTLDDMDAILREIPLIKRVSPNVDGRVTVIHADRNWTTGYRGVSPDYLDIKRWTIAEGVPFTDEAVRQASNVALIGETLRQQLFGDEDPIGKTIQVRSLLVQVVGVLGAKGYSGSGQDQDDTIMLPYTTVQQKMLGKGFTWLDDILCSAVSLESVNPAIDRVTELLKERHHANPGGGDDFNIRRPDEVIKAQLEASRSMETMLLTVAAIALLVGGIGIMNVMLVSVGLRTREIGVRMALGATRGDIEVQFLGEAVMLSLLGGVLGILVGVGVSFGLGDALQWPVVLPVSAIVVAPSFAIAAGLFFGFYPARLAASLDPIEALRHE